MAENEKYDIFLLFRASDAEFLQDGLSQLDSFEKIIQFKNKQVAGAFVALIESPCRADFLRWLDSEIFSFGIPHIFALVSAQSGVILQHELRVGATRGIPERYRPRIEKGISDGSFVIVADFWKDE